MKNQIVKYDPRIIQNEQTIECEECDTKFKSQYHLESHLKGSQHSIKSGINRKFGYNMNLKTTKRKLLRGASKNPFVRETKSTCEILNFSDGSYFVSVIPLIEQWRLKQESGEAIRYKDQEIYVTEQKCGKDQGGLAVDVLTKFESNGNNVVIHCYNTKQKMLVNGSGYSEFVKKYLEPYLKESIEENLLQVQNFNKVVTENLGKTQRKNVKYRPGSKLSCHKCEFTADDTSNMSTHRKITHTNKKKIAYLVTDQKEIITSTRDNSVVEIMNENVSTAGIISDSDDLEEEIKEEELIVSRKFHCFLCQAGFEEESDLTKHEETEHTEQIKKPSNQYI